MKSRENILTVFGAVLAAAGIIAYSRLNRRWRALPLATSRMQLLDIPIDPVTMTQALERVRDFIAEGTPHHVFTADASGIMAAQQDGELLAIVRQADLVTADGAGALLGARMRGAALPERVSGVDLVERICELAAREGYRVYFFGAANGVAQAAAESLIRRYPGLLVAGTRNGFFAPEEEAQVAEEIAAARPQVLFVALGIPKQEKFIRRYFTILGASVMVGIGGSFDVISGQLTRAPRWMQRAGLEWLYRLWQQPARLPRMAAIPRFIVAAWRGRKQEYGVPKR